MDNMVQPVLYHLLNVPLTAQDHMTTHRDPPPQNPDPVSQQQDAVPSHLQLHADQTPAADEAEARGTITAAGAAVLPWVSDASRASVMQLIWANFEVGHLQVYTIHISYHGRCQSQYVHF